MAQPLRHVALVGMMGSGKSTVGFLLARAQQRRFVDVDRSIETRTGQTIAEIFQNRGEESFRNMESNVLAELLAAEQPLVISCGGGAVLRQENRRLLVAEAWVCWLRATIQTLQERVGLSSHRPLLAEDPSALEQLTRQRATLYANVAGAVVDVDGLSVQEVVEQVLAHNTRWQQLQADSDN